MDDWVVPVSRGRRSSAGVDQYGETVPGEVVWEDIRPGLFAPESGVDVQRPGVESVRLNPQLYWEGEAPDVRAGDLLDVGGHVFEVVGAPAVWPLGCAVSLLRMSGGV